MSALENDGSQLRAELQQTRALARGTKAPTAAETRAPDKAAVGAPTSTAEARAPRARVLSDGANTK